MRAVSSTCRPSAIKRGGVGGQRVWYLALALPGHEGVAPLAALLGSWEPALAFPGLQGAHVLIVGEHNCKLIAQLLGCGAGVVKAWEGAPVSPGTSYGAWGLVTWYLMVLAGSGLGWPCAWGLDMWGQRRLGVVAFCTRCLARNSRSCDAEHIQALGSSRSASK